MRRTSVRRKRTVALLAFGFLGFCFAIALVPRDSLQDPTGVPVTQGRVVDQAELFPPAAVAAQVGAALDGQPGARCERQGSNLGVAVAAGRPLLSLAELGERLGPQL